MMNHIKAKIALLFLVVLSTSHAVSGVIPPDYIVDFEKSQGHRYSEIISKLKSGDRLLSSEKEALQEHINENETFERLYTVIYNSVSSYFGGIVEVELDTVELLGEYLIKFSGRQDISSIQEIMISFRRYGLPNGAKYFSDLILAIQKKDPVITKRYSLDLLESQGLTSREQARIEENMKRLINSINEKSNSCAATLLRKPEE